MRKSIIGIFLIAFPLSSCSPQFYTPNTQNVPLISEKGDNRLSVAGNGNQVELQGAYGITDAFAVQANGGWFLPRKEDNGNGGSGNFFELGAGYYTPVMDHFIFETYGLIGFGSMKNNFPRTQEIGRAHV